MTRATYVRITLAIVVIMIVCFVGLWGFSVRYEVPMVSIPVPGSYTEPIQKVCGSGGCSYMVSYHTPTAQEEVSTILQQQGWECLQITTRSNVIDAPYWRCVGEAFPKGRARIDIEPRNDKESILHLFVSWVPFF